MLIDSSSFRFPIVTQASKQVTSRPRLTLGRLVVSRILHETNGFLVIVFALSPFPKRNFSLLFGIFFKSGVQ